MAKIRAINPLFGRRARRRGPAALEFAERRPAVPDPARARAEDGLLLRPAVAPGLASSSSRTAGGVLDAYSFVGAFAIAAARGGAREVLAVDEERTCRRGRRRVRRYERSRRSRELRQRRRPSHSGRRKKGPSTWSSPTPPQARAPPAGRRREQALVAYAKLAENACRATRPGWLPRALLLFRRPWISRRFTRARSRTGRRTRQTRRLRWSSDGFRGADHPVPAAFRRRSVPEGAHRPAWRAR